MAHDEERANDHPFASKTFIASAGVVGLILILGIAVVGTILWPDSEDDVPPPAAASPTADPSPDASTAPAGAESICGLPGNDQTEIDEPPADTEWEFVGTTHAPFVPEAGPGMVDDNGFRQCYARSPQGALVAAANILAMGTDPNLVEQLNEELVAEGPGRDTVLADLESNPPTSDTGLRLSVAGYRLLGYGPDHARIDLAVEGSNGSIASMTTDLKWEEGDWKVELGPDGQPIIPVAPLADTVGYHPWSAEG
jgi:hypothetical protein